MLILVVCTANRCRSPMAATMLREHLRRAGTPAEVESAGFLEGGQSCPPLVAEALAERGYDLGDHVSTMLTPHLVDSADLVITMERRHVRELVVADPAAMSKTFTIKELVRRATPVGPRRADQDVATWLEQVAAGRTPSELLALDDTDDVADPYGRSKRHYLHTAEELDELTRHVSVLLAPRSSDSHSD